MVVVMKRSGQQTLLSFYKKRSTGPETGEKSQKVEAGTPANTSKPEPEPAQNEHPSQSPQEEKEAPQLPAKHLVSVTSDATNVTGAVNPEWKQKWLSSLAPEVRVLLEDEIANIGDSWLEKLTSELTKPYFKSLKEFLSAQRQAKKVIFPPTPDIYSWSTLCSLDQVKVVILGQDPYHNYNQAHGLAFSVLPPTAIPPSLRNIYKELGNCYPDYKKPTQGLLTPWAKQGVLLLNACLTVEAHKANSHAKRGWETFTERVLQLVAQNDKVVFMAWGSPAFKRIEKIQPDKRHLVLKSVHPSPLSASRGWFGSKHFVLANDWLKENGLAEIDWQV